MGLKITNAHGQTPLDPDEAEGLIPKNISTQKELNEFEQLNIQKAFKWSLTKKFNKEQVLSEDFIISLHKRMYRDVWKWAGQFRKTEKNIGVAPYFISTQLKQLLDDTIWWNDHSTFPEEEIAIRFKHRIVSIHCFPNGNGRHSRLMADIMISRMFQKEVFSWGKGNLQEDNDTRKKYISALKTADGGDVTALIEFARSGLSEKI